MFKKAHAFCISLIGLLSITPSIVIAGYDCSHCTPSAKVSCNVLASASATINIKNNTYSSLTVACNLNGSSMIGTETTVAEHQSATISGSAGDPCSTYSATAGIIKCNYSNTEGASGYFQFYACPYSSGSTACKGLTPANEDTSSSNNQEYFPYSCPTPSCTQTENNAIKCNESSTVCSHDCSVTHYVVVNQKATFLLTWANIVTSLTKGQIMANKLASYLKNHDESLEILQSTYNGRDVTLKLQTLGDDQNPFEGDTSTSDCEDTYY